MDTLTHALSGALLARATVRPGEALSVRRRVGAGFLAGAFPDSDVLLRLFTDPVTFLNWHRGVTHSLILWPLWALLLAWLFARLYRRDPLPWRAYFPVSALALLIHILGDVITTYGTQILAPFSDWKASLPTTFIIDPYFTGIILLGLLASLLFRHSRRPAVIGLCLLVGYIGFQALLWQRALSIGERYAQANGLEAAAITALPQPLSPFNWKIMVIEKERYHIAYLNQWRTRAAPPPGEGAGLVDRVLAQYRPDDDLHWRRRLRFGDDGKRAVTAERIWRSGRLAGLRRFIEYPVLLEFERNEGESCYWFSDLRFDLEGIRSPFQFGLCGQGHLDGWGYFRRRGGQRLAIE